MKKIICLVVVLLMIATVAIAAKKVAITKQNVASLKGTWSGMFNFGVMDVQSAPCTLEILNDAPPLKGKLTIQNFPDKLAQTLGITGGTVTGESDNGVITTQGTVMWTGQLQNFFEITLLDNKKASMWYFFKGMKGDSTLTKK